MRFRVRGRSRSACGCETGTGLAPSTLTDAAGWTPRVEPEPARASGVTAITGSASDRVHASGEIPLSAAPVGSRGRIAAVCTPGAPALAHRLHDLGFVTGATVEVVRRAPLGDPVLYRVSDYEICLRKAQAAAIRVRIGAVAPPVTAAPPAGAAPTVDAAAPAATAPVTVA